jgi:hydroxylamine reductase
MFCYQCEQTVKSKACTANMGVCGKDAVTSDMQDLLIHVSKGISIYARQMEKMSAKLDPEYARFVTEALFSTITNVNFDAQNLKELVKKGLQLKSKLKEQYESTLSAKGLKAEELYAPAEWNNFNEDVTVLAREAAAFGSEERINKLGADRAGLADLILFGLKGMAAYADHAYILGYEDQTIYSFFFEALEFISNEEASINDLLGMALRCGEVNIKVMELLDKANTETYGHPEPTKVLVSAKKGKAILVSGHDLKDLEELLKQTEGTGINVYTHGEMLPTLAYPGLKKYAHLAGNYGGAWQDQQKEFDAFPGSILMTTNCIQKPKDSYKSRIFTCGLVQWPDVVHISDRNFKPVIDTALASPGFAADEPEKAITIGFGRNTVLSVADKVIEAVKSGALKHFFLIGGCDGAKSGRNYYTDFAQAVPKDCAILTLACGKYRFNKLDFGDIGGIPRLLDVGQCNDAYSAIKIAVALAEAFQTDVNSLPLSFILSWYEQKAVCILLSLLHLGIKNMRLGPTLPAFVTPAAYNVLRENFNLMPITTAEEDLKAILG